MSGQEPSEVALQAETVAAVRAGTVLTLQTTAGHIVRGINHQQKQKINKKRSDLFFAPTKFELTESHKASSDSLPITT